MKLSNPLKLIISLLVPLLIGGLGSLLTTPSIAGWYSNLAKPALNPPNWVFGPVWTILYILMGISVFLVWRNSLDKKGVKSTLGIFIFQLFLNFFWSLLFFGIHNPAVAFTEILSLWFAIMALILAAYRISRLAAYLLIPYILWVSFAAYLNYAIWQLSIH
ncbi:MAG: TspO/MBR family protein [Patescibacteria group bacterium]